MAKEYSHRNLIVWQRAQELAHQVIQLTRRLPQTWANTVIIRQIIRAVTSIGANIAEGHGRFIPGAHKNHLSIAKGSVAETDSWLDLLRREGSLTPEEEARLHDECMEIMAILRSKILDLERIERERSGKMLEDREVYTAPDDGDQSPFPFVPQDYM